MEAIDGCMEESQAKVFLQAQSDDENRFRKLVREE
jgi:hypothetical protein